MAMANVVPKDASCGGLAAKSALCLMRNIGLDKLKDYLYTIEYCHVHL